MTITILYKVYLTTIFYKVSISKFYPLQKQFIDQYTAIHRYIDVSILTFLYRYMYCNTMYCDTPIYHRIVPSLIVIHIMSLGWQSWHDLFQKNNILILYPGLVSALSAVAGPAELGHQLPTAL